MKRPAGRSLCDGVAAAGLAEVGSLTWWNDIWTGARKTVSGGGPPPAPSLEAYIAQLSIADQAQWIDDYLATVSESRREEERHFFWKDIEDGSRLDLSDRVGHLRKESFVQDPPPILERRIGTTVPLPLFDFSAPSIGGCSMVVQTATSKEVSGTWRVSFGVRGAGTEKVLVSFQATFSAGPGESKQVFIPVRAFAIRRYATQPRLRRVSDKKDFDDVRLLPITSEQVPVVRSIPRPNLGVKGRVLQPYPLGHDATGGVTSYEYTYERTSEFTVGAGGKLRGVEVTASAGVALTKRLTLKIGLAGGHNYLLKAFPDHPGVYWQY